MAAAALHRKHISLSFGNVALGRNSIKRHFDQRGQFYRYGLESQRSGPRYSVSGVSAGLILAPGQSATLDATFPPAATGKIARQCNGSEQRHKFTGNNFFLGRWRSNGLSAVYHSASLTWTLARRFCGYDVYRSEVSGGPLLKIDRYPRPAGRLYRSHRGAG
jgi:hypothetical protein